MADETKMKAKQTRNHFSLEDIENYLREKKYPEYILQNDYGVKSNFRRAVKTFSIKDSHLFKDNKLVIKDRARQLEIVRDVHRGLGDSEHAKALSAHRGKNSTYEKIAARFFWYKISADVVDYIRTCEQCQKQGDLKSAKSELKSIPVPSQVMKQVGIDICNLPDVDGYHHVIVLIDYFSKWSEIKATKDKKASTIAQFLYEVMCRHGCFQIQINDQGREFVNEVSTELHRLTGVEQRVTSPYHPQANGLIERHNRTIKNSLVKVLEENIEMWPKIIEGVLFAHRVSRHTSTKYSPYMLMYNRDPILPIDVKHRLVKEIDVNSDEPFDVEVFDTVLKSASSIRNSIAGDASKNIKNAQQKQKRDFDKTHLSKTEISAGDTVLLRNNKRNDRKGGKFTQKWIGPYTVTNITEKGAATLKNSSGHILKTKYNVSQLRPYFELEIESPNGKDVSKFWDAAPDEIIEKILFMVINQSSILGPKCETINNMRRTCQRWARILESEEVQKALPKLYIDTCKPFGDMYNGKILVSARKLNKIFGVSSGLAIQLSNEICSERWRSSWLLLKAQKHSWFTIERIFWKNNNSIWLNNVYYRLTSADRELLESPDGLLNDQLMDAGQKLICKALGSLESYQSVLNCQKLEEAPYAPVTTDHIQLLHDGGCHWLLAFSSAGRVQVCDSLSSKLSHVTKKSLKSLFTPLIKDGKLEVTFLPSDKQKDGVNCGLYALAFASVILSRRSPSEYVFKVDEMRDHYVRCLSEEKLLLFPAKTKKITRKERIVTI